MGRVNGGTKLKEDWKELGVRSIGGWCNKVKDRGWLASKLGESNKKRKGKKTQDSRTRAMQKTSLHERLCRASKISSSI